MGSTTTTTIKPISPEPINCQWSDWSASGSCSKSCNGGSQKFRRFKTVVERNGGSCSGSRETYKSCNTQPCTRPPQPTTPSTTTQKPIKKECKSVNGKDCVFPFKYNGITHNKCTKMDSSSP